MLRFILAIAILSIHLWSQTPFTGQFRQITNGRTNAQQLWEITETTLYRSDDQGKTYRRLRFTPKAVQPRVAQILVDHRNSNEVFVLTSEANPRLFRTADAGATWAQAGNGLPTAVQRSSSFSRSCMEPIALSPSMPMAL